MFLENGSTLSLHTCTVAGEIDAGWCDFDQLGRATPRMG